MTGTDTKILVVDVDSNETGAHKNDGRPWYWKRVDELGGPGARGTGNGRQSTSVPNARLVAFAWLAGLAVGSVLA